MNTSTQSPLIYDIEHGGHRDRGVALLAKVLGGTPLIESPRSAYRALIGHRGVLVWQTADYARQHLIIVAAARAFFGRKTVALCYRNDADPVKFIFRSIIRRFFLNALVKLHVLKILRIFPPRQDADRQMDWIYDPEWWDIDAMSLDGELSTDKKVSIADPSENAFPIVLFIGNIDRLKGLDFFIAGAEEGARIRAALRFVLVGSASRLTQDQLQRLRAAGTKIIDERPSDAGFVAHIRSASFLWACYDPEYDQSSGIFGRALQLGIPSIVRRGSLLERSLENFGRGITVDYGDAAGLLIELVNFSRLDGTLGGEIENMRHFSISRLRAACGLQPAPERASNLVKRPVP